MKTNNPIIEFQDFLNNLTYHMVDKSGTVLDERFNSIWNKWHEVSEMAWRGYYGQFAGEIKKIPGHQRVIEILLESGNPLMLLREFQDKVD